MSVQAATQTMLDCRENIRRLIQDDARLMCAVPLEASGAKVIGSSKTALYLTSLRDGELIVDGLSPQQQSVYALHDLVEILRELMELEAGELTSIRYASFNVAVGQHIWRLFNLIGNNGALGVPYRILDETHCKVLTYFHDAVSALLSGTAPQDNDKYNEHQATYGLLAHLGDKTSTWTTTPLLVKAAKGCGVSSSQADKIDSVASFVLSLLQGPALGLHRLLTDYARGEEVYKRKAAVEDKRDKLITLARETQDLSSELKQAPAPTDRAKLIAQREMVEAAKAKYAALRREIDESLDKNATAADKDEEFKADIQEFRAILAPARVSHRVPLKEQLTPLQAITSVTAQERNALALRVYLPEEAQELESIIEALDALQRNDIIIAKYTMVQVHEAIEAQLRSKLRPLPPPEQMAQIDMSPDELARCTAVYESALNMLEGALATLNESDNVCELQLAIPVVADVLLREEKPSYEDGDEEVGAQTDDAQSQVLSLDHLDIEVVKQQVRDVLTLHTTEVKAKLHQLNKLRLSGNRDGLVLELQRAERECGELDVAVRGRRQVANSLQVDQKTLEDALPAKQGRVTARYTAKIAVKEGEIKHHQGMLDRDEKKQAVIKVGREVKALQTLTRAIDALIVYVDNKKADWNNQIHFADAGYSARYRAMYNAHEAYRATKETLKGKSWSWHSSYNPLTAPGNKVTQALVWIASTLASRVKSYFCDALINDLTVKSRRYKFELANKNGVITTRRSKLKGVDCYFTAQQTLALYKYADNFLVDVKKLYEPVKLREEQKANLAQCRDAKLAGLQEEIDKAKAETHTAEQAHFHAQQALAAKTLEAKGFRIQMSLIDLHTARSQLADQIDGLIANVGDSRSVGHAAGAAPVEVGGVEALAAAAVEPAVEHIRARYDLLTQSLAQLVQDREQLDLEGVDDLDDAIADARTHEEACRAELARLKYACDLKTFELEGAAKLIDKMQSFGEGTLLQKEKNAKDRLRVRWSSQDEKHDEVDVYIHGMDGGTDDIIITKQKLEQMQLAYLGWENSVEQYKQQFDIFRREEIPGELGIQLESVHQGLVDQLQRIKSSMQAIPQLIARFKKVDAYKARLQQYVQTSAPQFKWRWYDVIFVIPLIRGIVHGLQSWYFNMTRNAYVQKLYEAMDKYVYSGSQGHVGAVIGGILDKYSDINDPLRQCIQQVAGEVQESILGYFVPVPDVVEQYQQQADMVAALGGADAAPAGEDYDDDALLQAAEEAATAEHTQEQQPSLQVIAGGADPEPQQPTEEEAEQEHHVPVARASM